VQNSMWLRHVRAGERGRGVDYGHLARHASDLTPYVRDHLAHAARHIEELYSQLPSVAVPDGDQRLFWEEGREAYVATVCAALKHLGAALCAAGFTDSDLEDFFECEEDVKETKRDISSASVEPSEEGDDVEEKDSDCDSTVDDDVDTRTEVQETENTAGEGRVDTPNRHPFGV
jgi:hypothetical protein